MIIRTLILTPVENAGNSNLRATAVAQLEHLIDNYEYEGLIPGVT